MGGNVGFLLTIDLIFINLLYEKWDGYYFGGFLGVLGFGVGCIGEGDCAC